MKTKCHCLIIITFPLVWLESHGNRDEDVDTLRHRRAFRFPFVRLNETVQRVCSSQFFFAIIFFLAEKGKKQIWTWYQFHTMQEGVVAPRAQVNAFFPYSAIYRNYYFIVAEFVPLFTTFFLRASNTFRRFFLISFSAQKYCFTLHCSIA